MTDMKIDMSRRKGRMATDERKNEEETEGEIGISNRLINEVPTY